MASQTQPCLRKAFGHGSSAVSRQTALNRIGHRAIPWLGRSANWKAPWPLCEVIASLMHHSCRPDPADAS